jgi:hypothetical protein
MLLTRLVVTKSSELAFIIALRFLIPFSVNKQVSRLRQVTPQRLRSKIVGWLKIWSRAHMHLIACHLIITEITLQINVHLYIKCISHVNWVLHKWCMLGKIDDTFLFSWHRIYIELRMIHQQTKHQRDKQTHNLFEYSRSTLNFHTIYIASIMSRLHFSCIVELQNTNTLELFMFLIIFYHWKMSAKYHMSGNCAQWWKMKPD